MIQASPRARLVSTGHYSPPRVVTNAEMETLVDTNDEWIRSRVGISERRIAGDDDPLDVMAAKAGEQALLAAGLSPDDIDRFLRDALDFGATAISAHQDTVDEAFIDRAHESGLRVHCWFQDLATQARLAALPLDGIVTDWPVDARARSRGSGSAR